MKKYVIDGAFCVKKVTGIQRYAYEITKALDELVDANELEIVLLVPEYYDGQIELDNIQIKKSGNHSLRIWEQVDLPRYLKKNNAVGLYFENTIPLTEKRGIVALHDISLKVNTKLFIHNTNDRLSLIWRRIVYKAIANSSMKILTVSNFSKSEIANHYAVDDERIVVAYNAWQHMDSINESAEIIEKYSLQKGEFYFTMASMAQNKNFSWIVNAARNNPKDCFVIAGGGNVGKAINSEYKDLQNIFFLGYVTDGEAKALMHYCRAFIFPSFYEGFGIPPLEALACGTKKLILSDIPVFREVYGNEANYINPYDSKNEIDSSQLIETNSDIVLGKYSWSSSAQKIYQLLSEYN